MGTVSVGLAALALAAGACGGPTRTSTGAGPTTASTTVPPSTAATLPTTTATTLPACGLVKGSSTVPVDAVCSSAGAPHFDTPDAAMRYLAAAWNADDVREVDYVTDAAGRTQLDSMAAAMVNLQFKSCTRNPPGDYTCYFSHDVVPSPTTYPNPMGYPPGEAVLIAAPADGPGWYVTQVVHCG